MIISYRSYLIQIVVLAFAIHNQVLAQPVFGTSPISEPYPYVKHGSFSGPSVPESPDPLVSYRWDNINANDGLEIYLMKPKSVSCDNEKAFENLNSMTEDSVHITVMGIGSIKVDFGVECAAWLEFDSPDCPGNVEMSISEFNQPAINKTKVPIKYGNTYRLELNEELYEGMRFGWINVKSFSKKWHITGIRAVCQVKPTNYKGSFSCSDTLLNKIWHTSAYSVKIAQCKDYFGAILMDRGDRMSWTGDAHTTQAAALAAFGNYDFIKRNIDNTSEQDNGIKSYALYWVLSLIDYYFYTGDSKTMGKYINNACAKLDKAYDIFGTDPNLRFYGWDERLGAGFEIWFRPSAECQNAYKMLSIRTWKEFADAMEKFGRNDLRDKYFAWATEKMNSLQKEKNWLSEYGMHAAADAVCTGLLSRDQNDEIFNKHFTDRVNRVSFSPFNQYFIIQALARLGKHDDAISTMRDLWGGMINYGGTTTFEVFRPSWNDFLGTNDPVPNNQCGITSLCHPWGAGPVKWLNEEVLGIKPVLPGFKSFNVIPHLGSTIKKVSGKTPIPSGDIYASFDLDSGFCFLSCPPGISGTIGIPKAGKKIKKIEINGKSAPGSFSGRMNNAGVLHEDKDYVYFSDLLQGDYKFKVKYEGETPGYDEPVYEYPAQFVSDDNFTKGNWEGKYGNDGFVLCNYYGNGKDEKQLPSYISSIDFFRVFPRNEKHVPDNTVWEMGTLDIRALSRGNGDNEIRNATSYSNSGTTMTTTIQVDGTKNYQVALYFVDWNNEGLKQAVEMFDAETLNMIAPVKMVDNFNGGKYLIYTYNKSVKFRIDNIMGSRISLSGIFFDQAPQLKSGWLKTAPIQNRMAIESKLLKE